MAQSSTEKSGGLVKNIVVGALITGAVSLLNTKIRNKVKESARGAKNTSIRMYSEVKEDPSIVKGKVKSQLQDASSMLKKAGDNAQELYEKVSYKMMDRKKTISNNSESDEDIKEDDYKDEASEKKA